MKRQRITWLAAVIVALASLAMALPGNKVVSENNIRQIIQLMLAYSIDNNGSYPDSLDALVKYMEKTGTPVGNILTNPSHPDFKPGYVYVKPSQGDKTSADRLIVYERYDNFGTGIYVGYVDGHVDRITSEAAFKKLLDAARDDKVTR